MRAPLKGLIAGLTSCLWAGLACAQETAAPALPQGDLTGAIVKMLAALALVLAVLVGLYWLIRRFLPGQMPGAAAGGLRLIGRLPLGPKKGVALVEVAGRVLVLGLAEQNVNLLATIDDLEQVRGLGAGRGSFGQALKKAAAGVQEEKP
ncbi:MAG: flagellar biosynthetic protein FliO [Desulfarculus sp.]|nr:flagellar biosynthetic protein FliO [Desulfarculus sp.]